MTVLYIAAKIFVLNYVQFGKDIDVFIGMQVANYIILT